MSDPGEHLAHCGKFFGLNELLFKAFDFSDVAARDDHTFDFSGFIEERAEMAFQAAPFTIFVANLNFD